MTFDLKDYVDVAERLREFYGRHPNGRVVTELVEHSDKRVTVKALVYRDARDVAPAGVDYSSLAIPGSTPYTRGAELENASTSATGRAIVLAGIPSKRVASADEIAMHRATASPTAAPPQTAARTDAADDVPPDDVVYEAWSPHEAARNIFADDLVDAPEPRRDEFGLASALAAEATCPVHRTGWTFKEGTAKGTGRAYAFWSCNAKGESGYCKSQPKASWVALQRGDQ